MGIFKGEVYGFVNGAAESGLGGGGVNRRQTIGAALTAAGLAGAYIENLRRASAADKNRDLKKFEEEFGFGFVPDTFVLGPWYETLRKQLPALPTSLRTGFDKQVRLGFSEHELYLGGIGPDFAIMLKLSEHPNLICRAAGIHAYDLSDTQLVRGLVHKKVLQDRLRTKSGKSMEDGFKEILGTDYKTRLRGAGLTAMASFPLPISVAPQDTVAQIAPVGIRAGFSVSVRPPDISPNYGVASIAGDLGAAYVSGRGVFAGAIGAVAGTPGEEQLYKLFKDSVFEGREYESPYVVKKS